MTVPDSAPAAAVPSPTTMLLEFVAPAPSSEIEPVDVALPIVPPSETSSDSAGGEALLEMLSACDSVPPTRALPRLSDVDVLSSGCASDPVNKVAPPNAARYAAWDSG